MRTLGAAAIGALALLAMSTVGSSAIRPGLRSLPGATLTIRGSDWAPQEQVVLTLLAPNVRRVRRVVVGPGGTFTVPFGYKPARCAAWQVRAVGTTSGTVVLRRHRVSCASPDVRNTDPAVTAAR